jgi:hypothetical protein
MRQSLPTKSMAKDYLCFQLSERKSGDIEVVRVKIEGRLKNNRLEVEK